MSHLCEIMWNIRNLAKIFHIISLRFFQHKRILIGGMLHIKQLSQYGSAILIVVSQFLWYIWTIYLQLWWSIYL